MNQLKNPFQIYNIVFVSDVFFAELLSKCVVNVALSCVDFVLPKLFSSINNAFELQQNKNKKSHNWGSIKRKFLG